MKKEFIVFIIAMSAIVFSIAVIIGTPVYFYSKHQCYVQFKNYNPDYGFAQGCMVHYKDEYIPSDNIRVV